ncbi:valyl-tRNA ligase [Actibacterium atlanticum]|uniref:Valine--tRNA ligase n=1 Tax=Actibacterium atlanticum TaxID=1461693 RepID=A0A058ZJ19_9RHOB|nr:valine--tRNA ligase [Actibacterium atlanticum]KCV81578.1 valyl-tRNA ligase [Actibacterium atlanticum]
MPMEKKFDAAAAEARLYQAWEDAGCFTAGKHVDNAETSTFCVMIPPPNVTGVLHIGHAFNNTLQDILVRWHRMRGFDTLWQPGQDHAGIATQMVVERKLAEEGQPGRRELGREEFTKKIWDWKAESGSTIISQLKRLGASCDWDRNAFTMSGAESAPAGEEGNFHDAVIKVFVDMYEKGLIYRGKRLVNWDPHFETAISDLEVENIEVAGHMWHFKYPLAGGATYTYVEKDEDGNVVLEEERDYISIATTRPETMLGDGAVAVHPSDERYAPIVGKLCEIPVGPKEHRRLIPIITDEYPDKDFGSGAVKITGAHDFNDYQVAKRGGIPMYRLMDTKGHMRADGAGYDEAATIAMAVAKGERTLTEAETDAINLVPDDLRGLDRFEARKLVVQQITDEGLAVMTTETVKNDEGEEETRPCPMVENKPIMQPFGDRSKVVIEPMLTDQWFVDTDKIVGPALDAVRNGDTKILPESGEKTYFHWLENIEPWCISRQLWWGHQIPVWYLMGTAEGAEPKAYCAASFDEAADIIKAEFNCDEVKEIMIDSSQYDDDNYVNPMDVYLGNLGTIQDLPSYKVNGKTLYVYRDPDVLDTWFSSGLWPIGTLGWPDDTAELDKYFPTNTLVTGFDIIFFWVARMMMMQLAVVDKIPFDTVYLHGLVRDAKGKKMSKSTGNVIDPLEIIDEYGADALRFSSAAMAALGGVLKLDMQRIAGYRNFGTKIWNAARFAEMNGAFEGHATSDIPQPTATVNRWIIGETARIREVVDKAFEEYRFNDAANGLYAFVWGKVCDWYVEFAKPLIMDGDDATKAETRATMAWVLDQCFILLHPIMPYITEELWGTLGKRDDMLMVTEWPSYGTDLVDADADREMNWVIALIEEIRSVRAQMHVPAGAKLPMLQLELDEAGAAAWARNETLIKRLARIDSLEAVDTLPKGCVTLTVEGGTFGLPLADVIDVAEEKARLEKSLQKLAKELGGLQGRLKNAKFVASAPAEVVEETRELAALKLDEKSKLDAALARLAELA